MVECCQPSEENFSEDVNDERSKGSMDDSGATSTLQSERENPLFERLDSADSAVSERVNSVAVHIARTSTDSETSDTDVHETAVPGLPTHPPETSACSSSETASLRSKWPEQSEELLGLMVNSLRALDGVVPQSCPQPRWRPQSSQKIALILEKAPKHLQPDLVALVPKLVEHAEHPLAAAALLERLQKPDAEPALRLPVFDALSQLECSSEVWEHVLFQSFPLLGESNDESLATTINFIFKAATQCQHLQEAVRSVRVRLKQLGAEVSHCVLDFLSRTVHSWADVSEAILRDIDSDDDGGANCPSVPNGIFFGESAPPCDVINSMNEHTLCASHHFSDIYLLTEMLSIPCLAVDASHTFARAISRGAIMAPSLAMVLERRLSQIAACNARFHAEGLQHTDTVVEGEVSDQQRASPDDFTTLLGLAEMLALYTDSRVKSFVKMLYTMLFKWCTDDTFRGRMLKRLVDRATTSSDSTRVVDFDLEVLVLLVYEEQEMIKPVLSMMREVAELQMWTMQPFGINYVQVKMKLLEFVRSRKLKFLI